eukprot:Gregarina_sp_Poly_1__6148@NODE_324_length_9523_cov_66_749683_g276_i0_p5_GENE_NODE_324_length_9523_cov_66_749683_g276_i0NODE_324_length_9523_cov_66_749683_g276_i0_p5_ORF_typecomplete_len210_score15_89Gpr1_Fun34_YaaH/PF01184_19/1_7e39DUF3784/PF12650_7/9_2e02DUF3784/PF12650_7/0_00026DUF443/PF04276_12/1e04DUF443/PF04276_12/0_091Erg28/PF03694_13/89Erg28/PF03694_13/33Erg28/PF03694_13/2_1e02Ceramidase/PF05875_12/3_3e02Ceramidase/PF05875_12/1_9_NODE_324_length_9523_cov_66_749683_g276_i0239868
MEKPTSRLISTNPVKRYLADPSALGLFAFAVITFLSGTIHVQWATHIDALLYSPALLYGGVAQVIAGIMDMLRGEKVGGSTFIAFGIYWMSQGLYRVPGYDVKSKYPDNEYAKCMGWYIFCWGFVALSSTLAVLNTTVMQVTLMVMVTMAFFNLAFVSMYQNENHEMFTGYWLLVTGAVAWYNGTALLLRDVTSIRLPLGKLAGTNVEE